MKAARFSHGASSMLHNALVVTFCCLAFAISPAVGTVNSEFSVLHAFDDYDGTSPFGALIEGRNGELYGADYNDGTIFKISREGEFVVLHTFSGADGGFPESALVQDREGNLYGTTQYGGSSDAGTVFMLSPNGVLRTFHSFSYGDGYEPNGIIVGPDGDFYGTTQQGGANNDGVIFKISRNGSIAPNRVNAGRLAQPNGEQPSSRRTRRAGGALLRTASAGPGSSAGP